MGRSLKGWVLLITGFIACPCHFPLTLGIVFALAGGTALGGFLRSNVWLLYLAGAVYFVGALYLGARLISREDDGGGQRPASGSAYVRERSR